MAGSPAVGPVGPVRHIVVITHENHTTDAYFRSMAAYGADVATNLPPTQTPSPAADPPHQRSAYWRWLQGRITGAQVQYDTQKLLPYYDYLARSYLLLPNHCAQYGTNSSANHFAIVGGQSPTMKNPGFSSTVSPWDMPSILQLCDQNGVSWAGYTDSSGYPLDYYTFLHQEMAKGHGVSKISKNSSDFITAAAAGTLASVSMIWDGGSLDEHPTASITAGEQRVQQYIDAVVTGGNWASTLFLITWDDWGGFDDHVKSVPFVQYTPDNCQVSYGPRIPLLMVGPAVHVDEKTDATPHVAELWNPHASIPKTIIDLFGLPNLGVANVDTAPSLASLIDARQAPLPPPPGTGHPITPPPDPSPPRQVIHPPLPTSRPVLIPDIVLNGGVSMAFLDDAPLPQQAQPTGAPGVPVRNLAGAATPHVRGRPDHGGLH